MKSQAPSKVFAEAVNYLTENKLLTLEDLQERLSLSMGNLFCKRLHKKKSARMKELQELIREGENYQRLKPVHTELNKISSLRNRGRIRRQPDDVEHWKPPAVF